MKVSVIMPLYNKLDTVINSIKSILNQTYKDIELIIVDDCSNDGSYELVKEFIDNDKSKFEIILLRNEENRGCYYSRNQGILRASGKYIAFQDPDDFSFKSRIEFQMRDIKKMKVRMSFCSIYRFKNKVSDIDNLEKKMLNDIGHKKYWNRDVFMGMATSVIDKKLFDKHGLYDENARHSHDQIKLLEMYCNEFMIRADTKRNLHYHISKNLDRRGFFHYNKKLGYVSDKMNDSNITNMYDATNQREMYLKHCDNINKKF
jgi:glycosyltransferase involved in cell wall biosynthesis